MADRAVKYLMLHEVLCMYTSLGGNIKTRFPNKKIFYHPTVWLCTLIITLFYHCIQHYYVFLTLNTKKI